MPNWVAVALALGISPSGSLDGQRFESVNAVVQTLTQHVQTGTLLVSEGDCVAVKVFTQSPYTHVAAIVVRNGQPIVYDSASGVGVRCQSLERYLERQSPSELHVFQPRRPLPNGAKDRFETYLDSQLGRSYAVQHHLTGERADGVHCAEYVTDALQHSGLLTAKQPARVSPASLVEGITQGQLYATGESIRVAPIRPPPLASTGNWCAQLWEETKSCTVDCCRKTKSCLLCR